MNNTDKLRATPAPVLRRQRANMSAADMAKFYGVSLGPIYAVLKQHGIKSPAGICAKLTVEQVRQIRKEYKICRNASKIAENYNVCSATIGAVVHRRTWKWVE